MGIVNEASATYFVAAEAHEVLPGYKRTAIGTIPEDWESSTVRGIASSARNAIVGGPFGSDLVAKDYAQYGIPVIRGQNLSGQWVSGNFAFVTQTKADSLKANLARPGDIVFTQRGTLGQVSLVPARPFELYLVSQSQMKLSVNRDIADPLFFYYVFTSDEQQNLIRGGTIQTGVPHINLGILRDIPVQLPPTPEQRAIAQALSDVDGLLGALEALIAKKRAIKQGAMQQLLSGKTRLPGFSGEWETKLIRDIIRTPVTDGPHLTPKFLPEGIPFLSVNNLAHNRVDTTALRYISLANHHEFSKKCKPQKWDVLLGKAASVGKVAIVDFDWEFNIWSPIALIRVDGPNVLTLSTIVYRLRHQ